MTSLRLGIMLSAEYAHFRRLMAGAHAWAQRHGAEIRHLDASAAARLDDLPIDAVLMHVRDPERQRRLARMRIAAVKVTAVAPTAGMAAVHADDRAVGALAARHLLGLGLRRLLFAGQHGAWHAAERAAGFLAAGRAAGAAVASLDAPGEVVRRARGDEHLGVCAVNDQLARRIVQDLLDAGIEVPGRVAVMGVDDDEFYVQTCAVPLTSVDLGSARIGWEAAALAAAMVRDRSAARVVLVPPLRVVPRRSTDALAIADPHVATAVRWMRAHACAGIGVDDVLARVPLSRRSLERGVRAAVGVAPAAEIERVRIEEARRLLAGSALAIHAVARRCGYASTRSFLRAFRRVAGATPARWRGERGPLAEASHSDAGEQAAT